MTGTRPGRTGVVTRMALAVFVALLLLPAARAEQEWRMTLGFGVNHDSNTYRQANREFDSNYLSGSLDVAYKNDFNKKSRFFTEFDGRRDFYDRVAENADSYSVAAEVGFRWTPYRDGWRKLRLIPRVFYDIDKKAYISRQSGLEIAEDSDRFNYQDLGVGLLLEYRLSRRWDPMILIEYKRRNYLEDFLDSPLTDSLDYLELRVRPAIVIRHGRSRIDLGVEYREKTYDEKFPRARDGSEILPFFPPGASEKPYEPLSFTYVKPSIEWNWRQSDRFRLVTEYEYTDRRDEFLDYMSYSGHDVDLSVFWGIGRTWRLYFGGSWDKRSYDNARVNFDPLGALRRVTYSRAVLRVTYRVSPKWEWFVFARGDDEANLNPIFDYGRVRFGSGVRFRIR